MNQFSFHPNPECGTASAPVPFPLPAGKRFTLLELIVVMTVMVLAASMAVAVFRGESPARKIEKAGLEFEEFCARVRFQALESGEDRLVVISPETRVFRMKIPEEFQPKEGEEVFTDDGSKPAEIEWTLPENFSFGENLDQLGEEIADDGTVELFRFFPDGSASGKRKLEFRYGDLLRTFEISTLTGRVTKTDGDESEK
ncbi:MAG: hypothetical protein BWY31_00102 [Lentisphaerae bacterium ADurb.Bin242]|nr:MAG: hypothetical protein BWY31_00102 [Lentisphaerae bacterium ADurb.Bin242]